MMGYTLDFSVVWHAMPALLWGCVGTLGLALAGMTLAMIIGVAGVAARDAKSAWLRTIVIGFVEIVRNTPFLVQIFFLFFALPLVGLKLNPTATAIIALGVNGGAYAIEIIRGGVQSIPLGQIEAGLALGLAPAAGIPSGGAEAGAAGDLPGVGRPVHPADADLQHLRLDRRL